MLRSVNYGSTQSFAGGRVAAMPSVGRIKQLSVLGGVAAALLAVGASSASAATNEVWLWACHGPDGSPLSSSYEPGQIYDGTVTAFGGGCGAPGGGLELKLAPPAGSPAGTPINGVSEARATFHRLPGDTVAKQFALDRSF